MSQKASLDYSFKIVLIGDPTVGKTSIILRFVDNVFIPDNVTTSGVNIKTRDIQFGKKNVKVILTDTAGQERFRTISRSMYRDADAVIIAYDQANEKSFASVRFWYTEVEKYAGEHTLKFVVSNKIDINNPAVSQATAKAFADEQGVPFLEVSAKNDVNIDYLFQTIVQSIGERMNRGEDWSKFRVPKNTTVVAAGGPTSKRKSGFCILL